MATQQACCRIIEGNTAQKENSLKHIVVEPFGEEWKAYDKDSPGYWDSGKPKRRQSEN